MTSGFLLDTNVVSETRRIQPNPRVVAFLESTQANDLYMSVVTVGELRKGVAARRNSATTRDTDLLHALEEWVTVTEIEFVDRILPITIAIAKLWGELSGAQPRPVINTLLAATALAHDLTLVTRNTKDILDTGVDVINPWEGRG